MISAQKHVPGSTTGWDIMLYRRKSPRFGKSNPVKKRQDYSSASSFPNRSDASSSARQALVQFNVKQSKWPHINLASWTQCSIHQHKHQIRDGSCRNIIHNR